MILDRIVTTRSYIKYETELAILFNLPKNKEFEGFSFWVAKESCVFTKSGDIEYIEILIAKREDFEIKLIRYGRGQYKNKSIEEEKIISSYKLIEIYKENKL